MSNPLGSTIPQAFSINPKIKQMLGLLRAGNPGVILQQLAQNNPQLASIVQMCQGRNPQQVFYSLCQQRGINPEDILNQLQY